MKILFVADVSIENVIGSAERVLFEQSTRRPLQKSPFAQFLYLPR